MYGCDIDHEDAIWTSNYYYLIVICNRYFGAGPGKGGKAESGGMLRKVAECIIPPFRLFQEMAECH